MKQPKKATLNERQRLLFEFLKSQEKSGNTFTPAKLAETTGYKRDSVRTNLSEGHWTGIVVKAGKDTFRASGVAALSEREFHARISQSKKVQAFGYRCANPLAGSLLARSRDNIVLALELYNRPSLSNRIDGFVMLFCTAWEQTLKAELIERNGEDSIFEPAIRGQSRRSIGLTECMERIFEAGSLVRKNLETIQQLRDNAVHLLVPALQPIAARLFQSGVFNFARHFRELAGEPLLPHTAVGLLTLVGALTEPHVAVLADTYGPQTTAELEALIKELTDRISGEDSWSYAVPIKYRLVFSDSESDPEFSVVKLAHDALDARTIAVVEKPRDRKHTHPYLPTKAVSLIAEQLKGSLSAAKLVLHLGKAGDAPSFIAHDFQAVQFVERWNTANNKFHYSDDDIKRRWFSTAAVEHTVEKICKDETYLKRARDSLNASRKGDGRASVKSAKVPAKER